MKINYDYQIFSQQIYGGISRYFVEIAKGISYSEGKNSVNIISPLYINEYLSESEYVEKLFYPGLGDEYQNRIFNILC